MCLLEKQRALYASQLESWQLRHDEAMLCRDVEETIDLGLNILKGIRRRSEAWGRGVERTRSAFSWEDSKQFAEQFRWWLECSQILVSAIEVCENRNYRVESASEFRKACREVSLMSLNTEQTERSIASLEEGKGVPAKQALDELRNRLRDTRS